ncbi:hypothetical protein ABPG72_002526 [Tetrahymena utriculariae]
MIYLQEQIMTVQVNNDESDVTDAYNIFLNLLKISDEKQTDSQSDVSSYISNSKSYRKVKSFEFKSNQIIPLKQNKPDQIEFKVNQNILVYDEDNEKVSDFNSKLKETNYQNKSSDNKISNKSIMLTEDGQAEFNNDNQKYEKNKASRNLGNTDENSHPQQSSSLSKMLNINTVKNKILKKKQIIEQHSNKLQRSLKDGFQKKKSSNFNKKSKVCYYQNAQNKEYLNNLIELVTNMSKRYSLNTNRNKNQQKINEIYKQEEDQNVFKENFTEFLIRKKRAYKILTCWLQENNSCSSNNKIQNFIQVQDNEIFIDRIQNSQYYYVNYNCKFVLNRYKSYQDKKMLLQIASLNSQLILTNLRNRKQIIKLKYYKK